MRPKKEGLHAIGSELAVSVQGAEHYSTDSPSIIVANHTSMRDIFTLPAALPEACKIVMSSRLMWKRNTAENSLRRQMIEQSLHGIPLEVFGGKERLQVGLDMAKQALVDGWSLVIFPEGAYTGKPEVTQGRTGAARILFDALSEGIDTHIQPAGINQSPLDDIDDHLSRSGFTAITIGQPLDHSEQFQKFQGSESAEDRKGALRSITDVAMQAAARHAGYPYVPQYIPLTRRETIMLESGEEVPIELSQQVA